MAQKRLFLSVVLSLSFVCSYAQHAIVTGIVRDEKGKPMDQAIVADEVTGIGTYTNSKGFYSLEVIPDKTVTLIYGFAGHEMQRKRLLLISGETRTIDVILKENVNELKEFTKTSDHKRDEAGNVYLDLSKVDIMPSTIGGVEGLIKVEVGSHDEL